MKQPTRHLSTKIVLLAVSLTLLLAVLLIATWLLSQQSPATSNQPVTWAVGSPTATMPPVTPSATLFRVDEAPAVRPQPSVRTDLDRYRRVEPTTSSASSATGLPTSPPTADPTTAPTLTTAARQAGWPTALVPLAIPLADSDPGTWQVQDGSLIYLLPEGLLEGEGLGSLPVAASLTNLSIGLSSSEGEDCGLAFGTADHFTLLRLTTGGLDQTLIRSFVFQADNFAAPSASASVAGRYAGVLHQLSITNTGLVQLDGQPAFTVPDLDLSHPLLYASGNGCTFNHLETRP